MQLRLAHSFTQQLGIWHQVINHRDEEWGGVKERWGILFLVAGDPMTNAYEFVLFPFL